MSPKIKKIPKNSYQRPKGMKDLLGDEYFAYQGFCEKAAEIAYYYGFRPIETPVLEKEELFTRSVGEFTDIVSKEIYKLKTKGGDKLALKPEGTAPIVRAYIEHGMQSLPQPVMLYYSGRFYRHEKPQRGRSREFRVFGVEVIGSEKSVCDAIVIKVVTTILTELGSDKLCVEINSMGDKECKMVYKKALVAYFRKHVGKFSPHAKDLLKSNPLRLLDTKDPSVDEFKKGAPASIDFLLGPAKQHFKEVLEYLESMGIEYRINNQLVRGLDYYSRTVFEVLESKSDDSDEKVLELAGGGRYDYLAKMIGAKKHIGAVGAGIGIDRVLANADLSKIKPRNFRKPKVYFIQLGFDAKLKSLSIIDALRVAKVPIEQSLSKDSLSTQLGIVERTKIPWVIILGQKEVIDHTVIVRNMADRSQETINQKDLPLYLKQKIAR